MVACPKMMLLMHKLWGECQRQLIQLECSKLINTVEQVQNKCLNNNAIDKLDLFVSKSFNFLFVFVVAF